MNCGRSPRPNWVRGRKCCLIPAFGSGLFETFYCTSDDRIEDMTPFPDPLLCPFLRIDFEGAMRGSEGLRGQGQAIPPYSGTLPSLSKFFPI